MTDLDRLLDTYPTLPPDERAAADLLLADRPDRWDDWHQARRLAALFDASAPDAVGDHVERSIDRRMGRDSDVGDLPDDAEKDRIEKRLDRFEQEAEDPVARFERMTGRRLEDIRTEASGRTPREKADEADTASPSPLDHDGDSLPALPFIAPRPRRRRLSHLVVAVGLAVLLYGALRMASEALATPRERLADLGGIDAVVLRNGDTGADSLVGALRSVGDARRSWVGLLPHYDPEALDAIAAQLDAVADRAKRTSWVSQEARLALGRIYLYRERDVEAARALGGLVGDGAYRAPIARRLLDAVRSGVLVVHREEADG